MFKPTFLFALAAFAAVAVFSAARAEAGADAEAAADADPVPVPEAGADPGADPGAEGNPDRVVIYPGPVYYKPAPQESPSSSAYIISDEVSSFHAKPFLFAALIETSGKKVFQLKI